MNHLVGFPILSFSVKFPCPGHYYCHLKNFSVIIIANMFQKGILKVTLKDSIQKNCENFTFLQKVQNATKCSMINTLETN